MAKIETREVLADAYLGPNKGRTMLSHAVAIDNGRAVRVLCGRVMLGSIADRYASDPDSRPSCTHCLRKDPRWAHQSQEISHE